VHYGTTNGMVFTFLYTTKEYKKFNKSKSVANACSSNAKQMKIYRFTRSSHTKSTSFVDVQVVERINMND
jgi:hypothetical protein